SEERASQLRSLGSDVWRTLTGYVHGTAFNGFVNAVLLSIALLGLGVPLVLPIALLTFVGGFLPLVGGIVSGLLAALVTLVAKGPLYALIVVGCTVVIHNVEGYLSGPLVLRRAVSLHPVAILLVLAVGSIAGGVIGAFVAVPLTAVIVAFVGHMRRASLVTVHGGEIRASDIRPVGSQGGGDQARGDQARGEQARLEQLEAVRRASGLD
ncbi:MAG: AI-2E family transporter, partial [Acidimicrobiales bacterium]